LEYDDLPLSKERDYSRLCERIYGKPTEIGNVS
jgi:hypothetical protein